MKTASAIAGTLLFSIVGTPLATPAAAGEQVAAPIAASSVKESVTVDCSKKVWPTFLLRASATPMRLLFA